MVVSARAQRIMIWSALTMATIMGLSYGFLIQLLPLPPATWSAAQVAAFYSDNSVAIRMGSLLCSYTSAFMVPLAVVIAAQMVRLEKGFPIWSVLQLAGGCMMSIFLVLPPVFWGIAAFSPNRPAEVTMLMHEQANLLLVTTDQYFIFQFIAIIFVSLTQTADTKSPFPRWFGFLSAWIALIFEAGAIGFIPKTGPFAWNGLFVYWLPLTSFGVWILVVSTLLLKAISRQERHGLPR